MTEHATDTTTATTINADEVAALKAQLAEASEQLAHMAGVVLADVPEHLKPLIPVGLGPAAQAAWVQQARAAGLFAKPTIPTTDTTKPTVTPKAADVSSLPPLARMAAGYAKH